MIAHPAFVWLHLPRTAGTATAAWMRAVAAATGRPFAIDPDEVRAKHDNLAIRAVRDGDPPAGRVVAMNIRPLADWLRSNYLFATAAGLKVAEERYRAGEYFSLRTGRWCPADWWLDYFEVDEATRLLRLDRLEADWRALLGDVAGLAVPETVAMKRANLSPPDAATAAAWRADDASAARSRNPRWAALEDRLFGGR